ncbi:MAG: MBL fold metallo-hydrolase [Gammaproteobacteria bacterium]|nr:MBL fold metallo-hydrolase [Gammaproteobacteria bacterium]
MTEQTICQDVGDGVTVIDLQHLRSGMVSSHLLQQGDALALVDVGTHYSVPRILAALAQRGLSPRQVKYVCVTHVHLDHAGGAGELLQHLPEAQLVVHPRGARHMLDPAKLVAGATAVYGEAEMDRINGAVLPVDAARIIEAVDGLELDLGGRHLRFFDTPGHARHHYSIYDEGSRGVFSGDIFGLSYRALDVDGRAFIFPTTTPVQFDPVAAHRSIDEIVALAPKRVFLTHFGPVSEVPGLAAQLHRMLDDYVVLARQCVGGEGGSAELPGLLATYLFDAARGHGCDLPADILKALLQLDVELNAQGLDYWASSSS